jgi:hypothetical protein
MNNDLLLDGLLIDLPISLLTQGLIIEAYILLEIAASLQVTKKDLLELQSINQFLSVNTPATSQLKAIEQLKATLTEQDLEELQIVSQLKLVAARAMLESLPIKQSKEA